MADGAINFFLDATDDPLLPDQIPSFEGGMFSNVRANLLQPNQSNHLVNCDIDKLGKLRTRRGTTLLGTGPPSGTAGTLIQGLTSYHQLSPDTNYVVAANDSKIWKYTDGGPGTWTRIATGGVADQAEMLIYREGKIDRPAAVGPPAIEAGYLAGTTVLTVKEVGYVGVTAPPSAQGGIIGVGEKLYFTNNLRTDWYEYTIAAVSGGPPVTQITLEEPGLVFDVKDGWKFVVARPARNVGAHLSPTGTPYTGTLTITGYTGVVNAGEHFVIKSENKRYIVDTFAPAAPTSTTSLTGSWGALSTDFVADNDDVRVVFAQGNDKLYFSDGTGPIYAWDGTALMNITTTSTLDYLTGSTLHRAETTPPQDVTILLWFQNRLIASGIATEPDAIYFSDFFDGTSWDRDYQKVRIGGGESDPITGLVPWMDYNLIVFKKNSIYVINLDPNQNPFPDDPTLLVASYAVKQLHKRIGCPAPRTAVQVGGGSSSPGSDIFFLDGDKKVHSIRRVMAAETQQEVGQAMSLPIQDVVDQINADYIGESVAFYHNEHYILGIPTLPRDEPTMNNVCVVYNLLTQSWCGNWRWRPTCFAMRTDLGAYSRMIFGDTAGNVVQWMDDLSLDEETATTYQDVVPYGGTGDTIDTIITTRAITFGDLYSYKTGISVEIEFDQSIAEEVYIEVVRDQEGGLPRVTPEPFNSSSIVPIRLGTLAATLPFTLPPISAMVRAAFDLQRYGTWRELLFQITALEDKLAIRSIRVTGYMDTIRLQSMPDSWVL